MEHGEDRIAEDAADLDGVALLEGAQGHHEQPGRDVREQPGPGHPDRDSGRGQEAGEGVRLHPDHPEGRDHEQEGEENAQGLVDVLRERRIELPVVESAANHAPHRADHPAPDYVERDRGDHLNEEVDAPGHEEVPGGFHHGPIIR